MRVHGPSSETPLEDEPRFVGGAEISLVHGDLSLAFDKATRAYSLTCYGDDGEGVRLTLEPFELEQIVREFLAARAWPRNAGVRLAPLSLSNVSMELTSGIVPALRCSDHPSCEIRRFMIHCWKSTVTLLRP
jgi:hypothetical protein